MAAIAGGRPRRMAGVASHPAVLVRKLGFILGCIAPCLAVLLDGLCQPRLLAVVRIAGSDCVAHLHYFPFLALIEHGALIQPVVFPVEAALLPRRAQSSEIGTSGGGGPTSREQKRPLAEMDAGIPHTALTRGGRLSHQVVAAH